MKSRDRISVALQCRHPIATEQSLFLPPTWLGTTWGWGMLDRVSTLETVGLSGVPFTAPAYFAGLRMTGADPYRTETHIGHSVGVEVDQVAADKLHAWARANDPDRALQKEYARQMWADRKPDEMAVFLG